MSKRMSVAAMTVAVLVAACGANATPTPTPTPMAAMPTPPAVPPTPTPAPPTPTPAPPTPTPAVSDPDSARATLLQHKDRWERSGVADYDYVGAWVCFCPPEYLADVTVSVRGGVVTSFAFASGEFTGSPPSPERFVPVEGLFEQISQAVAGEGVERLTVVYDREYGHPVEFLIDRSALIADDETIFSMREFTLR